MSLCLLSSVLASSLGFASPRPPAQQAAGETVADFDVLPALKVLGERCFECHGSELQRGALRLDFRQALLDGGKSGAAAVFGDSEASLLMRRVIGRGGKPRMPRSGPPLGEDEIAALAAWIDAGAPWPERLQASDRRTGHWAYRAPTRPEVPLAKDPWVARPLDGFVLARLRTAGLKPSPAADRNRTLRRVKLDLVGLPPTEAELAAFLEDARPDALERAVDAFLASPRFGERWAALWLDLARYADTQGYEKDGRRTIWRYRDWVIDAFNRDLPFDQFTVEQLAGDLLPEPTTEQLIATAFHRNTMTNTEGGTDDEEFRVAAVVDRVNTTLQVWMGTTIGCAQCHDHKYDPISQQEYYQLFAFLNNTEDRDLPNEAPVIPSPTADQSRQMEELDLALADLQKRLLVPDPELDALRDRWAADLHTKLNSGSQTPVFGTWKHSGPYTAGSAREAFDTVYEPERVILAISTARTGPGAAKRSDRLEDLAFVERPDWVDGKVHTDLTGGNSANYLYRTVTCEVDVELPLSLGSDDSIKLWVNSEPVLAKNVSRAAAADQEFATVKLRTGENHILMKIVNGGGPSGFYFEARSSSLPKEVLAVLTTPGDQRSAAQNDLLHQHFRASVCEPLAATAKEIERKRAERAAIKPPTTPIFRELAKDQRRKTHVLAKGSFLSPGEEVGPAVPEVFPELGANPPRDRLGFARWLVDPAHPLTSRVMVNRVWEQLFGIGLVDTTEDFGTQGSPPSHPELLDWLAGRFIDQGWSLKALLKEIVLSNTYRQSSRTTPELLEADPYNRLLTRGPRVRLDAETIRDQALAVSDLLSEKMYGPSVMPPQPDGVWQVVYSSDAWRTSPGEDKHRRGLYTFWRRTSPYPSMVAFDAPSREFCVLRRIRTNTPLQALVTLNDPVYVEAATALARLLLQPEASFTDRVHRAYLRCVARQPDKIEVQRLQQLYTESLEHFQKTPEAVAELLNEVPEAERTTELAAWTVLCNVLLNLDEFLTKG